MLQACLGGLGEHLLHVGAIESGALDVGVIPLQSFPWHVRGRDSFDVIDVPTLPTKSRVAGVEGIQRARRNMVGTIRHMRGDHVVRHHRLPRAVRSVLVRGPTGGVLHMRCEIRLEANQDVGPACEECAATNRKRLQKAHGCTYTRGSK